MRSLVLCIFLSALSPAFADGPDAPFDVPDELSENANVFEVLSLSRAAAIVEGRFDGKLIAARIVPPFPDEAHKGVQLVYELRLLTPRRDVLLVRLDARNGDFLEVAGTGLSKARRKE